MINLPKSFFGAVEVSYLGFWLTHQGITPGMDKQKGMADAKPNNNVHEVRQFLCLCNFFRGHVWNSAMFLIQFRLKMYNAKGSRSRRMDFPDQGVDAQWNPSQLCTFVTSVINI
jgi:hypothetical protein